MVWSKNFPGSLDTTTNLPNKVDNVDDVVANDVNTLRDIAIAIENEVGTNPANLPSGCVRERVSALESVSGIADTIHTTEGGVGGTDVPVGSIAVGQFLQRDGSGIVGAAGGSSVLGVTSVTLAGTCTVTATTTDPSTSPPSPSWQQIINGADAANKMEITFSTTAGQVVLLGFQAVSEGVSAGYCSHWLGLDIDGTAYWWGSGDSVQIPLPWGMFLPYSFSAGSHTVKLIGARHTADRNIWVFGSNTYQTKLGAQLYAVKL